MLRPVRRFSQHQNCPLGTGKIDSPPAATAELSGLPRYPKPKIINPSIAPKPLTKSFAQALWTNVTSAPVRNHSQPTAIAKPSGPLPLEN